MNICCCGVTMLECMCPWSGLPNSDCSALPCTTHRPRPARPRSDDHLVLVPSLTKSPNTRHPHPLTYFQLPLFILLLHPGFQVLLRSANGKRSVYTRATDVPHAPPPCPGCQTPFRIRRPVPSPVVGKRLLFPPASPYFLPSFLFLILAPYSSQ